MRNFKHPGSHLRRGPFKKEPPSRIEPGKEKESGKDGTTGKHRGRTGNRSTNRSLSPLIYPSRAGKDKSRRDLHRLRQPASGAIRPA